MTDHGEASDLNRTGSGSQAIEVAESVRLAGSVTSIAGVRMLAPGLRELVATAAAKVLRRAGGEPTGVDVSRGGDGVKVRIDAHLDDTRSVADVVDEIFAVIKADLTGAAAEAEGEIDIDLRIVSRGR